MWRWVTWSVCHFFCLNSFSKASSTTAWAWMSRTSPTGLTASRPITSGSITSTTLTTWGRLVCSLTGSIKLHEDWATQCVALFDLILLTYIYIVCLFVCASLSEWHVIVFFLHHMWLSICPCTLFVYSTSIYLCLSGLSFHPYFRLSLYVFIWMCVYVFTGSDVLVCAGIEGRLGQYHVSWSGCSGSGPAGNVPM